MPEIDPSAHGAPGQSYTAADWSQIFLLINSVKSGQTIYVGWTANYVIYLEWGHSQQAPNGFIGITALEWNEIVAGEIEKAKNSVAQSI
jgi:hypothetical protein